MTPATLLLRLHHRFGEKEPHWSPALTMSLLSAFHSICCTWSHGFLPLMGDADSLALGFGTEQDTCPFLRPPESALEQDIPKSLPILEAQLQAQHVLMCPLWCQLHSLRFRMWVPGVHTEAGQFAGCSPSPTSGHQGNPSDHIPSGSQSATALGLFHMCCC